MEPIFVGEMVAFDMYFASIVSMQVHPGAGTKEHAKMNLEQCRDLALSMILLRRELPIYTAKTEE